MRDLTAYEQRIVDAVETHGWFALSVAPREGSSDPREWFTYTIGLPKSRGWPELICFGLDGAVAHNILTDAIAECDAKRIMPTRGLRLTDTLANCDAVLSDGSQIPDSYFGSASWFGRHAGTGSPPARLQLLWPDKKGHFPHDSECDPAVRDCQAPKVTQ